MKTKSILRAAALTALLALPSFVTQGRGLPDNTTQHHDLQGIADQVTQSHDRRNIPGNTAQGHDLQGIADQVAQSTDRLGIPGNTAQSTDRQSTPGNTAQSHDRQGSAKGQGFVPAAERIWGRNYASFTSLASFKGNYYLAFREGGGHVWDKDGIAAGKIRILRSKDGSSWESVALFSEEGHDLRDPKLSVTPDNRLMVTMGGSVYHGKSLDARHPYVCFSRNGRKFTALQRDILAPGLDQDNSWIWRITWHNGTGYGVDYTRQNATLVKTQDGISYTKVTSFDLPGFPNEATIRFLPDGRMSAFVRHDDKVQRSHWGVSEAPYTEWKWKEVPFFVGGPDYLIYGDRIILAGRRLDPVRTSIMIGDFEGNFREVMTLPSGGDTSYPGLLMVGDELWVSYYSCHEGGDAAIYFSRIPLKELSHSADDTAGIGRQTSGNKAQSADNLSACTKTQSADNLSSANQSAMASGTGTQIIPAPGCSEATQERMAIPYYEALQAASAHGTTTAQRHTAATQGTTGTSSQRLAASAQGTTDATSQRHAASGMSGWDFMLKADGTEFWQLDSMIVDAVLAGNVPSRLRSLRKIRYTTRTDSSVAILNRPHTVEMWVLEDYVSIGNDSDFVRMPMSPIAAQRIADALGCSLPTTYLVDRIDEAAEGRLDIFPFRPRGSRNQDPIVFQDHNNVINALFKAKGYGFGQFISGLKKDIVLTCRLERTPGMQNNVAIYGWHHPDGHPQQPLYIRHANYYSDYSHGVRLIWRQVSVDGVPHDLRSLMEDPELYRLVSNEDYPLQQATLAGQTPR